MGEQHDGRIVEKAGARMGGDRIERDAGGAEKGGEAGEKRGGHGDRSSPEPR
jgi:hypothetical protein